MALSNRINFRGGQSSDSKLTIYKDGVWNVGYDNGGFTYNSNPTNPFTLNPTNFSKNGESPINTIGTASPVNITKYRTLHVVGKNTSPTYGFASCGITPTKNIYGVPASCAITTVGEKVDYACDISNFTGDYYIVTWGYNNGSGEVNEIYLME